MPPLTRRQTVTALVGGVPVGSGHPDRRPVDDQHRHRRRARRRCARWRRWRAPGSELVRVTVNNEEAAAAVPAIVEALDRIGVAVPIIGDFHYNGHLLLTKYPGVRRARWRSTASIPATSAASAHDENFRAIIEVALANDKPVRIGVNWGSLDQNLLTEMMDANARRAEPAGRARR